MKRAHICDISQKRRVARRIEQDEESSSALTDDDEIIEDSWSSLNDEIIDEFCSGRVRIPEVLCFPCGGISVSGMQRLCLMLMRTDFCASFYRRGKLHFNNNSIGDDGVSMLGSFMNTVPITELQIENDCFWSSGFAGLGAGIATSRTLEQLELWRVNLDDAGCVLLADGLKVNKSLETVTLGNCLITSLGARVLVSAIKVSENIKELDLSFNRITENGMAHLLSVFWYNDSIQKIALEGNPLGPKRRGWIKDIYRDKMASLWHAVDEVSVLGYLFFLSVGVAAGVCARNTHHFFMLKLMELSYMKWQE